MFVCFFVVAVFIQLFVINVCLSPAYNAFLNVSYMAIFSVNLLYCNKKYIQKIKNNKQKKHSHCGRIANHLTWIGFSTTYGSGTSQNWKDQIPCGLCCSHSHDKNRSESRMGKTKNQIWDTFACNVKVAIDSSIWIQKTVYFSFSFSCCNVTTSAFFNSKNINCKYSI